MSLYSWSCFSPLGRRVVSSGAVLAACFLMVGCNLPAWMPEGLLDWLPFTQKPSAGKVASPPDIPVAIPIPAPAPSASDGQELPLDVAHPRVRAAMERAVAVELFKPDSLAAPDTLALDRPVTRAELATWFAAFRNIQPVYPPVATFADVDEEHALYGMIESMAEKGLLDLTGNGLLGGKRLFLPEEAVSRQAFCRWVLILQRRKEALAPMDEADLNDMGPPNAMGSQRFAQVADRVAIAPDLRQPVAIAYQEGLLESLFGLTPQKLTGSQGLRPTQPVTRAQALVFLAEQE